MIAMLTTLAMAVATPGFQDIAALDRAVAAFTGHAQGQDGGARIGIDRRLRLATCPTVSLAWRSDAHDAVVVACPEPSWRVFVAVQRPAAPPAGAAPAVVAAPAKQAPVIHRGDPIVIEAGSDGFAISRAGVAMADAAPGAHFPVRVDDAKPPIQAVALADGRATLPGWTQ